MYQLPETGYLRLRHIVGDPKAVPPIPAIIPVSKSTFWAGVKSGRFPRPVKLGPRVTAWRVEDIRGLIERKTSEQEMQDSARDLQDAISNLIKRNSSGRLQ